MDLSIIFLLLSVVACATAPWHRTQCGGPTGNADVPSRWADEVSPSKAPLPEYPRPNLVRSLDGKTPDRDKGDPRTWVSLNGLWEWEPAGSASAKPPIGRKLASSILVPFPVESCLSGVAPNSSATFVERSWYRLVFSFPKAHLPSRRRRFLLRFGAVNWRATVFINGRQAAEHTGGYDGFSVELPQSAGGTGEDVELIVGVYNPADNGAQPNGKARVGAITNPGGDTYTPASGIWQSVWIEEVPSAFISKLQLGANMTQLTASATVEGAPSAATLTYEVRDRGVTVTTGTALAGATLRLSIPTPKLWSPESPVLYDLFVSCDVCNETVLSYFGMRTFRVGPGPSAVPRPLLNGKFVFLGGWLDQSYWPDGIYTAPTDAALAFDLTAVLAMGLNTVRLHQKVNPERWYYHADRLGILVLQDAVQKYGRASEATIPYFETDLVRMILDRGNHPSIVQWETFNEIDCWYVFKDPPNAVADVVALAKQTDWQDRPVDTDSGGLANRLPLGDVFDIHSYPNPGRPSPTKTRYAMIGEYGGIGAFIAGKEWVPGRCHTYLRVESPQEEAARYINMTRTLVDEVPRGLSAAIYTQITDVELECDGFFNYDRSPKFSDDQRSAIVAANRKLLAAAAEGR